MRLPEYLLISLLLVAACGQKTGQESQPASGPAVAGGESRAAERLNIYAPVQLTADLSALSARQKQMLPLLIAASDIMDDLFWLQAYGDREEFLAGIRDDATRRFAAINYGPWDRLDGDKSFMPDVGPKPAGARFYPEDMTREEFEAEFA